MDAIDVHVTDIFTEKPSGLFPGEEFTDDESVSSTHAQRVGVVAKSSKAAILQESGNKKHNHISSMNYLTTYFHINVSHCSHIEAILDLFLYILFTHISYNFLMYYYFYIDLYLCIYISIDLCYHVCSHKNLHITL